VRLEDETVWLTQAHVIELFQTTKQNLSLHIQNIFEEGELSPEATHKKYLTVRSEGKRQVKRPLDYYNLDMIISVGYRVKSHVATRPPLTTSCAPVMYLASSEARKSAAWATSQASPILPVGHC
jgi:hypothetical protein